MKKRNQYKKRIKIIKKCLFCEIDFESFECENKKFCSVSCKKESQKGVSIEERFGKEKADELRKKYSNPGDKNGASKAKMSQEKINEKAKKAVNTKIKNKTTNKGKTYEEILGEEKAKILKKQRSETRKFLIKTGVIDFSKHKKSNVKHSEERKKEIGIQSRERWKDKNFREKQKQTRIKLGLWRSDEEKTELEVYNSQSYWIERMWDYITCEDQLKMLKTLGVLNTKTNPNGVCRDHKLSRLDGFKNNIHPILLRHPCNLQVLTNKENISKGSKSSITLIDLINDIINYNGKFWKEHEECLKIIKEKYNEYTGE